jgi:hypothetical protein
MAELDRSFVILVIGGAINLGAEKTETITNLFDTYRKNKGQDANRSSFDTFVRDSLPPL